MEEGQDNPGFSNSDDSGTGTISSTKSAVSPIAASPIEGSDGDTVPLTGPLGGLFFESAQSDETEVKKDLPKPGRRTSTASYMGLLSNGGIGKEYVELTLMSETEEPREAAQNDTAAIPADPYADGMKTQEGREPRNESVTFSFSFAAIFLERISNDL